jgi:hypothetical protein
MAIIGKAAPRSEGIIERVAEVVGCEPAVIDAIIQVETNADAFDPSRRLVIRPEFHKVATCPYLDPDQKKKAASLSTPKLASYELNPVHAGSVAWQWVDKMAAEFGEEAAFWVTSFGSPQIMGFNFQLCKYESPSAMVRAFADSEDEQLLAMGRFIVATGLKEACRMRKWKVLARGYNGANYAVNAYDTKLAFAYEHSSRGKQDAIFHYPDDDVLEFGDKGQEVKDLQNRLCTLGFHLDADGDFGVETRDAVRALQFRLGLPVDGKVGPDTRKLMASAPTKEPNAKPVVAIVKDSGIVQSGIGTAALGSVSAAVAVANAVVTPVAQAPLPLPGLSDVDALVKSSESGVSVMSKILAIGVDKLLIALAIGAMLFGGITIYRRIQAQRLRKIG